MIWLWRLLTVWMCRAPRTRSAGGAVDALVRDVERRRDGRIAAVGVGDEQGIAGDDRLQRLLHAVCVESGQGMAEGRAGSVGGVVRHTCVRLQAQELTQRQAVGAPPLQRPLTVEAFEVADQVHPEVTPRWDSRTSDPWRVIGLTQVLGERIETGIDQPAGRKTRGRASEASLPN